MNKPLEGLFVVELTTYWAAPSAGEFLRCLGARVVKIETGKAGDSVRYWGRMEFVYEHSRLLDLKRWKKLHYMNNKTYPDTMLGLWVNLEEELPNYLEEDNIGITTVAVPDGNGYKYIVYDGTNADEMTGFYVPEAAEARDDFSDRSYLAPVGEAQINEYNAKGYKLTQTVLW